MIPDLRAHVPDRPSVGSLCTGYGGLETAARELFPGMSVSWYAESDPFASQVMAEHLPGVPNLGDITAVDWAAVPGVDVLTAGFPCTDISNAGLREGITGSRSGIWKDVARAVRALRPRLVLLENVAVLTGRGLNTVAGDLAASGYALRWTCTRASETGAPHPRHRWFGVAVPVSERPLPGRDALPERMPAHGEFSASGLRRLAAPAAGGSPALLPTPTTADGTGGAGRSPKRKGGDNLRTAVTLLPTPAARDWKSGQSNIMDRNARPLNEVVVNLLPTPKASDGPHGGPNQRDAGGRLYLPGQAVRLDDVWLSSDGRDFGPAVRRWEAVTGRSAPDPAEDGTRGNRRLSPAFAEWMMGVPAGHATGRGLPRKEELRMIGNGVVPQQAIAAYTRILDGLMEEEHGMTGSSKQTGICRVCGQEKTLTANGRIRSHGPVADRCDGGSDLPCGEAPQGEADAARARVAAGPGQGPNPHRAPLPAGRPSWAGVQPFHDQEDTTVNDDTPTAWDILGVEEDNRPTAQDVRDAEAILRSSADIPYEVENAASNLLADSLQRGTRPNAQAEPEPDEADAWLGGTADDTETDGGPGPWFPSRYDGDCDPCGAHFDAGEDIRADGQGGWQGRECCGEDVPDDAPAKARPRVVQHKVPIERGRYVMPHPKDRSRAFRGTRVTTFVKLASDHFSLSLWQQRTAVVGLTLDDGIREEVLALLEAGVQRGDAPPVVVKKSRDALDKLVERSKSAAGASLRASRGTALHKWTEEVDAGRRTLEEVPSEHADDITAYRSRMDAAGITVLPHLIERTTAVLGLGVVGTFDRVVLMPDGKYRVADVKSGDLKYGQDEIAAQMAVYAHGCNSTGIAQWDGEGVPKDWASWSWVPLTGADGQRVHVEEDWGVVVHLPQGEAQCDLYEVNLNTGWRGAELCAQVRDWHRVKSTMTIMSVPDPETPPEPAPPQARPGDALAARMLAQSRDLRVVTPAELRAVPPETSESLARISEGILAMAETPGRDWEAEFSAVPDREAANALYAAAKAAQLGADRMAALLALGRAALAKPAEPSWEQRAAAVGTREQARELYGEMAALVREGTLDRERFADLVAVMKQRVPA